MSLRPFCLLNNHGNFCAWSIDWQLVVQAAKCAAFSLGSLEDPDYSIGITTIPVVDSVRDLRIIMDSKLNFRQHIISLALCAKHISLSQ